MIMSAALMGGGIWIIARLKMLVLQVWNDVLYHSYVETNAI
jgi:hypothetical protein